MGLKPRPSEVHPRELLHCKERFLQRYGMPLDSADYDLLCCRCARKLRVKVAWDEPDNKQTVYTTRYLGHELHLVRSHERGCITTILRPEEKP